MFVADFKPSVVAVMQALEGGEVGSIETRLCRIRVMFPDVGRPVLKDLGFWRFGSERPFFEPEATERLR